MKARALIANASFGPAHLKVIGKAFDDAWEQVAPSVSTGAAVIEAARLRLANIILNLAKDGPRDAAQLTDTAVRLMKAIRS